MWDENHILATLANNMHIPTLPWPLNAQMRNLVHILAIVIGMFKLY